MLDEQIKQIFRDDGATETDILQIEGITAVTVQTVREAIMLAGDMLPNREFAPPMLILLCRVIAADMEAAVARLAPATSVH